MLKPNSVSINQDYVLLDSSNKLKQYFSNYHNDETFFKVDMMVPLHNHLNDILGYLVVGFDTSSIIQRDKEFMLKLFFLIVIMMLVLGGVLHQGFEHMLKHFTTQVYTDHLTGTKNRLALNDRLFPKENHVLLLCNIKDFSLLNELYGVDAGNEILIQISNAFELFASDFGFDSFRVSGDEFVLLKQIDEFDSAYGEQILKRLNSFIQYLDISVAELKDPISVEIHTGLAFNHSHSLEDAQMALKIAKEKSLPYVIYSKHVDTKKRSETIMQVKRTIRYAIEHNNIIPFFQPITNREGKTIKYEALVRIIEFENGVKKILTPNLFLDISMQSGLYIEIAKEMVKKSLSKFETREEKISVNFLPNDFFNPIIFDSLLDYIKRSNSPENIVVEITEQESVEDFERLVEVIKMLRKLGVLIAIDDFGSGYANYSHILTLKPDYLKIDGSLIRNILTNNESQILVKSIIHFAKELDIITVAEYVENLEIFELLKEYGVDEFQGYYFGKPIDLNG